VFQFSATLYRLSSLIMMYLLLMYKLKGFNLSVSIVLSKFGPVGRCRALVCNVSAISYAGAVFSDLAASSSYSVPCLCFFQVFSGS